MQLDIVDLIPYITNWWTYSDVVNKEEWFITRIYWGYFHKEKWVLDLQKNLKPSEEVTLKKDPNNQYDINATEVLNSEWKFLWFLRKELAAEISDTINFKVIVKNPYNWDSTWNKNSIWTEIIVINLKLANEKRKQIESENNNW